MTNEREKYLEFLLEAVELDGRTEQFSCLLEYLFNVNFVHDERYILDEDRVQDGILMREKYAEEYVPYGKIDRFLRSFGDEISVLEFLISLCQKMSETLYFDSHLSQFFWQIITNLGLDCMTDDEFLPEVVDSVLKVLFNRKYCRDGSGGGMFCITNSKFDLTKLDFFRQGQLWMSYVFVE